MFFRSGDARLFVDVAGSGADVVLLHPTPMHHGFWLPAAAPLRGRYRTIVPDLRGHGQSESGEGAITMEKLGSDLLRMLDELDVPRAVFIGCSVGGYVLYELWRRAPQRVQGLGFCCSKPQADTDANRQTRDQWMALVRDRGTAEFFEAMSLSLLGGSTQKRLPGKAAEARAMMQSCSAGAILAIQQGLASRPDSVQTARSITVPTLVIAGGEDESSTPADMRLLARSIRNGGYGAEFHLLEDAGHYAPWEQPERTGVLLRRFVDSVLD